jgi:hypothetical protein
MDMNLPGRLKNTSLPRPKVLLTLYEAVFNAFQAIEDGPPGPGHITIKVDREPTQVTASTAKDGNIVDAPVQHIHITDTGIGFTDENVTSFKTSDTQYKADRGGKGVGRFMWLKAFAQVRVESVIEVGGERILRTFDFTPTEGVTNEKDEPANHLPRLTTVHLLHLRPDYQKHWNKRLEVVASKLVEHVLIYLLRGNAPQITIQDDEEVIDVSELFREISAKADERSFVVKENPLKVRTFRLYRTTDPRHRLHLCAEEREVTAEPLDSLIADLARKLVDEDGHSFVVSSYVSGPLLDESVTPDRLNFTLPDSSGDEVLPTTVTQQDVRDSAAEHIRAYLRPQLETVGEEKRQRVRRFVEQKAPEYRPILVHRPEALDQIPPGLTDEKLDAELHRITYRVEAELRASARTILDRDQDDVAVAEEQVRQFIEEQNAFGSARLASYIGHRKIVLEFLERRLGIDETGKRPHESAIHELVFPLKNTSADVPIEQQNLWLLDERLSYHRYLASDLPLNQTEGVDVDGTKRPDLLIFQAPFAFVETDAPFLSVVIIEFKRAMRDDYDDDDNPIQQVYEYVDRIKAGRAVDRTGMQFTVPPTTPFYCYIVANVTPKLQKWARFYNLTPTPDAGGFFGYNKDVGTYIEVTSYQKLIADAKKRNRILFEKLNLPERFL